MFDLVAQKLLDTAWASLTDQHKSDLKYNPVILTSPQSAWDCSMLYVSMVSVTPGRDATGCVDTLTAIYHLGFVECYPTLDDNGVAPSSDQVTEANLRILGKVSPLYNAIHRMDAAEVGLDFVEMRPYSPQGPMGGYAGGEWLVNCRKLL